VRLLLRIGRADGIVEHPQNAAIRAVRPGGRYDRIQRISNKVLMRHGSIGCQSKAISTKLVLLAEHCLRRNLARGSGACFADCCGTC